MSDLETVLDRATLPTPSRVIPTPKARQVPHTLKPVWMCSLNFDPGNISFCH